MIERICSVWKYIKRTEINHFLLIDFYTCSLVLPPPWPHKDHCDLLWYSSSCPRFLYTLYPKNCSPLRRGYSITDQAFRRNDWMITIPFLYTTIRSSKIKRFQICHRVWQQHQSNTQTISIKRRCTPWMCFLSAAGDHVFPKKRTWRKRQWILTWQFFFCLHSSPGELLIKSGIIPRSILF